MRNCTTFEPNQKWAQRYLCAKSSQTALSVSRIPREGLLWFAAKVLRGIGVKVPFRRIKTALFVSRIPSHNFWEWLRLSPSAQRYLWVYPLQNKGLRGCRLTNSAVLIRRKGTGSLFVSRILKTALFVTRIPSRNCNTLQHTATFENDSGWARCDHWDAVGRNSEILKFWNSRTSLLATKWRRLIGSLVCIVHFPQKWPIFNGSFVKNDLQPRESYESSPPNTSRCKVATIRRLLQIVGLFCKRAV